MNLRVFYLTRRGISDGYGLSHTGVMQTSHEKYSAQWSDKTPKTNKTQVGAYLVMLKK